MTIRQQPNAVAFATQIEDIADELAVERGAARVLKQDDDIVGNWRSAVLARSETEGCQSTKAAFEERFGMAPGELDVERRTGEGRAVDRWEVDVADTLVQLQDRRASGKVIGEHARGRIARSCHPACTRCSAQAVDLGGEFRPPPHL